jgi:hypothetical protein
MFWIRDILRRIWIRTLRSVHWTKNPDPALDPDLAVSGFQDA